MVSAWMCLVVRIPCRVCGAGCGARWCLLPLCPELQEDRGPCFPRLQQTPALPIAGDSPYRWSGGTQTIHRLRSVHSYPLPHISLQGLRLQKQKRLLLSMAQSSPSPQGPPGLCRALLMGIHQGKPHRVCRPGPAPGHTAPHPLGCILGMAGSDAETKFRHHKQLLLGAAPVEPTALSSALRCHQEPPHSCSHMGPALLHSSRSQTRLQRGTEKRELYKNREVRRSRTARGS